MSETDLMKIEWEIAEHGGVPAAYFTIARRVRAGVYAGLRELRVALLCSGTMRVLDPYLTAELARRGFSAKLHFAEFSDADHQALVLESTLYAFKPHIVVVIVQPSHFAPNPNGSTGDVDAAVEHLKMLVDAVAKRCDASIIAANFSLPAKPEFGIADWSIEGGQAASTLRANADIADFCRKNPRASVFDFCVMAATVGAERLFDSKIRHVSGFDYSLVGAARFAQCLARTIAATRRRPKKVLVLDLDNTLWGGILGEDGIEGLQIGDRHPGGAFRDFQRYLLSLRARGVLLAINSKNDATPALEALEKLPGCLLKPHHFSAIQINWRDKARNIEDIAAELSLGIDSFAFFDDSAFERMRVAQALPEVLVVDVPDDPLLFIDALERSEAFDMLRVSVEDRKRADMYATERVRREKAASASSYDEFLKSLDIRVSIGRVDAASAPRAVQLLERTNQFNLTRRRYSATELEGIVTSGAIALWVRARDNLGDSGLVGLAVGILDTSIGCIRMDSFVMSCRVLGRGIEDALLYGMADLASKQGIAEMVGEFCPGPKNAMAADFYSRRGFRLVSDDVNSKMYRVDLATIPAPNHIAIEFT